MHKFGGTSVANADCFRAVATIIRDQLSSSSNTSRNKNVAVVVSAMGGKPKVTDLLLEAVQLAADRNLDRVEAVLTLVRDKHATCLADLFPSPPTQLSSSSSSQSYETLLTLIENDLNNIRDILKTVSLMKWPAQRIAELVSGYGELWSTQILTHLLQQLSPSEQQQLPESPDNPHENEHRWAYIDARRIITVDEDAIQDGVIVWDHSQRKLEQVYRDEWDRCQWSAGSSSDSSELLLESNQSHPSAAPVSHPPNKSLHLVITGYVASNTHGVATTLKRDGSDYSAAIVGRLLCASSVSIWTDVDGVLSADPRRVPLAIVLPEVSYNEAMELAYFGAKVIHPKTMQPAITCQPQIPLYIRNTFAPHLPGTRIYISATHGNGRVVCGFSSIEHMALVNVEGSGMMGVPGVAMRIFGTLERHKINVVLISQASSEHSVTFCTVEDQAELARHAMEEEFRRELAANRISSVDIRAPCSIIAAVGDGMSATTGVAGRFFSALGDAKINVHAIAQGSSERNISAVVWSRDSTRALRAVHAAFHLSYSTVRVAVVGMTDVGESLLKLLEAQRGALRASFDIDVQVCAVLASEKDGRIVCLQNDDNGDSQGEASPSITMGAYTALVGTRHTDHDNHKPHAAFQDESSAAVVTPGGVGTVLERLFRADCPSHAVFDCTNDATVGQHHAEWLRAGIDVVTANNTGLSGPKEQRVDLKQAEKALGKQSAKYMRQVTVAGGLPVLSTLRSLLHSGDRIRRIDGIFTVVLSYVMYRISPPPNASRCSDFDRELSRGAFAGDMATPSCASIDASHASSNSESRIGNACSFREAVQEAIALGLTEDDPTTDLNNEYTARVLMVLARELGMDDDNEVERIRHDSDTLWDFDLETDVRNLPAEADERIQARVDAAKSRNCVLRNISSIDVKSRQIEIKIVEVPDHHVFAVAPPTCSTVRFFTQRHKTYPLIVQGPSAGADSTASALLAELLQRTRSLTNPRTLALTREGSGAFLQKLADPS